MLSVPHRMRSGPRCDEQLAEHMRGGVEVAGEVEPGAAELGVHVAVRTDPGAAGGSSSNRSTPRCCVGRDLGAVRALRRVRLPTRVVHDDRRVGMRGRRGPDIGRRRRAGFARDALVHREDRDAERDGLRQQRVAALVVEAIRRRRVGVGLPRRDRIGRRVRGHPVERGLQGAGRRETRGLQQQAATVALLRRDARARAP